MKIEITIPENATLGDLTTVKGALFEAAANFVDWEKLYNKDPEATSAPGLILLLICSQIDKALLP